MKTSQKIRCQPIITRKRTSKKGLVKMELEISDVSEFSILALYWNRKLGNIFKTFKFQRSCFIWESWKFPTFPSFRFWPLYWNRKLGKLRNFFKTSKFEWISFIWEKLGISEVSEFSILTLILKSKTQKTRKFLNSSNKVNPLKFTSWKDFRVFRAFDISIRANIEDSETSEISYFLK